MKFLFPGFLFALITLAAPVIIHLFNFRKFKKVYFSNVALLKEVDQKTSSSRNLKNLLLLAARILTLVFLVLAFSQPYIVEQEHADNAFRQQAVSIFIDNSYSMDALNKEGSLLDEAKRRAKEIASAYSINDKFQLLTNDFEGKHQRLLSHEDFIKAVDEVRISGLSRPLKQIVERQKEVFSSEPNSRKTLYIISDFQRSLAGSDLIEADSTIAMRMVALEANQLANISIDSVWFISPVHKANDPEKLVVRLKNNSEKRAENVPIKVSVDGRQKAIASLTVEARSKSNDTLSFSGLSLGWKKGLVRITDYPIVFDDDFYFSFNVRQRMPVLALHDESENVYLRSLYQAEQFFDYKSVSLENIDYSKLSAFPLIILSSTNNVSEAFANQLKHYVQNGGNLMVFPGTDQRLTGLSTITKSLGTDVADKIVSSQAKVSDINLQHPLFQGVFSQMPGKIDLPVAQTWVQYSSRSNVNRQQILDMQGRSFLSQYSLAKGKVYLSAVALDEKWSNLVRHSVFVPVMYQAAYISLKDPRLSYTIGQDQFLESNALELSANQTLKLKQGSYEAIPDLRNSDARARLFISDQIKNKGIYQLLKGDSLIAEYAFNDSRKESDLSYLSKEELKDKFPKNEIEVFKAGRGSMGNTLKAANNGLQLWKLCLILALVFLAAEILIIRFYKAGEPKLAN